MPFKLLNKDIPKLT